MRKVFLWMTICLMLSLSLTVLTITAWGSETVLKAQERLTQLGYEPGPADGGLGVQTIAALKKFQQDHKLKPTGTLDRVTIQALGINPAPSGPEMQASPINNALDGFARAKVVSKLTDQKVLARVAMEDQASALSL